MGEAMDSPKQAMKGMARQAAGKMQSAMGDARERA
jgi:uncharacterized protein YjbJ (UPF0337 family)